MSLKEEAYQNLKASYPDYTKREFNKLWKQYNKKYKQNPAMPKNQMWEKLKGTGMDYDKFSQIYDKSKQTIDTIEEKELAKKRSEASKKAWETRKKKAPRKKPRFRSKKYYYLVPYTQPPPVDISKGLDLNYPEPLNRRIIINRITELTKKQKEAEKHYFFANKYGDVECEDKVTEWVNKNLEEIDKTIIYYFWDALKDVEKSFDSYQFFEEKRYDFTEVKDMPNTLTIILLQNMLVEWWEKQLPQDQIANHVLEGLKLKGYIKPKKEEEKPNLFDGLFDKKKDKTPIKDINKIIFIIDELWRTGKLTAIDMDWMVAFVRQDTDRIKSVMILNKRLKNEEITIADYWQKIEYYFYGMWHTLMLEVQREWIQKLRDKNLEPFYIETLNDDILEKFNLKKQKWLDEKEDADEYDSNIDRNNLLLLDYAVKTDDYSLINHDFMEHFILYFGDEYKDFIDEHSKIYAVGDYDEFEYRKILGTEFGDLWKNNKSEREKAVEKAHNLEFIFGNREYYKKKYILNVVNKEEELEELDEHDQLALNNKILIIDFAVNTKYYSGFNYEFLETFIESYGGSLEDYTIMVRGKFDNNEYDIHEYKEELGLTFGELWKTLRESERKEKVRKAERRNDIFEHGEYDYLRSEYLRSKSEAKENPRVTKGSAGSLYKKQFTYTENPKITKSPPRVEMQISIYSQYETVLSKYSTNLAFMREALQNSSRAFASRVDITIKDDMVIIKDNGVGIQPDPNSNPPRTELEVMRDVLVPNKSGWTHLLNKADKPFGEGFLSILKIFGKIEIYSKDFGFFFDWKNIDKKKDLIEMKNYGYLEQSDEFGYVNGFVVKAYQPRIEKKEQAWNKEEAIETAKKESKNKSDFYGKKHWEDREHYDRTLKAGERGVFINGNWVKFAPKKMTKYHQDFELKIMDGKRTIAKGWIAPAKDTYETPRTISTSHGEGRQTYEDLDLGYINGDINSTDSWGEDNDLGLTPNNGREFWLKNESYKRLITAVNKQAREIAIAILQTGNKHIIDAYSQFIQHRFMRGKTKEVMYNEIAKYAKMRYVPARLISKIMKHINESAEHGGKQSEAKAQLLKQYLDEPDLVKDEVLRQSIKEQVMPSGLLDTGEDLTEEETAKKFLEEQREKEDVVHDKINSLKDVLKSETATWGEKKEAMNSLDELGVEYEAIEENIEKAEDYAEDFFKAKEAEEEEFEEDEHVMSKSTIHDIRKKAGRKTVYYVKADNLFNYEKQFKEAQYYNFSVVIAEQDWEIKILEKRKNFEHLYYFSVEGKIEYKFTSVGTSKKWAKYENRMMYVMNLFLSAMGNSDIKAYFANIKGYDRLELPNGGVQKKLRGEQPLALWYPLAGSDWETRQFFGEKIKGIILLQRNEYMKHLMPLIEAGNNFDITAKTIGAGDINAMIFIAEPFIHELAHGKYGTRDKSERHYEMQLYLNHQLLRIIGKIKKSTSLYTVLDKLPKDAKEVVMIPKKIGDKFKNAGLMVNGNALVTIEYSPVVVGIESQKHRKKLEEVVKSEGV